MRTLNRRTLLTASATATLASTAISFGERTLAASANPAKFDPRGHDGILERLPSLDLESRQDLLRGFREFVHFPYMEAAGNRASEILKAHGMGPDQPAQLDEVVPLFDSDPMITTWARSWIDGQQHTFRTLAAGLHRDSDRYFDELEAADKAGPGSLELHPGMALPDSCRREFHGQPGGYCGDPFAGYLYHYYSLMLDDGADAQDQLYVKLAAAAAVPTDGKVHRVLDLGTGAGQYATALKKRYPDAEVWGIDSAGPMVRYAHMWANDIGSNVQFAQRLAQDSKFPANHFDVVVSNLLHHEVTADGSKEIFRELQRILRKGGVYQPTDFYTDWKPLVPGEEMFGFGGWLRFRLYVNHRWVYEPYLMQWANLDFRAAMRAAGLSVADTGKLPGDKVPSGRMTRNVVATKA